MMKRRELTAEQKLDLLESIIARLFGWWGSVKVDWEQDYMGARVILRNVDLDGEKINLISDLKGMFNFEIDSRSIVEEEDGMIPMKGGKDLARKYRYIHNEIDLTISPNYEQYLLNQTPEEIEDIRKGTTAKWTEDDRENRDHRYFSMDGGSIRPSLFRFKRSPENIRESIQDHKNSIKYLRRELKKAESES